jgi:transcription elongation factor Elf1
MTPCGICTEVEEVRCIDLHITGSEGLNVCVICELMLVLYIREMRYLVGRAKR